MATVMSEQKCKQCGYESGTNEFNCRTNEWTFDCRRCGYGKSLGWMAGILLHHILGFAEATR